jgi:hypothetical protein
LTILVAPHADLVDQEESAQGDGFVEKYSVGAGYGLVQVRHQRKAYPPDAAVLAFDVPPREVRIGRVDRDADHLHVPLLELLDLLVEGYDLRRADEGEVQRIEEKQHIAAPLAGELELADRVVRHDRLRREVGSHFRDQYAHRENSFFLSSRFQWVRFYGRSRPLPPPSDTKIVSLSLESSESP